MSPDGQVPATPRPGMPPFAVHALDARHVVLTGSLPKDLLEGLSFDVLWELHPPRCPEIHLHGRRVPLPRWQQAYGVDYHFSGQTSAALAVPTVLHPLLAWCQSVIDPGLNGLLLNWYDGRLGHHIGRHRDSTRNRIPGSTIVTASLGEERAFRLRPWPHQPGTPFTDFPASHGSVLVLPWDTNHAFTHEVPPSRRRTGRRISITLRAFHPAQS